MSFRTSAHTGVGISIEFQAAHRHTVCSNLPFPGIHSRKVVRLSGGLPRQCAHWLAMTGNSIARQIPICRATERYRAGQGENDYRPRSSRLGRPPCGQIPIYPTVNCPLSTRAKPVKFQFVGRLDKPGRILFIIAFPGRHCKILSDSK